MYAILVYGVIIASTVLNILSQAVTLGNYGRVLIVGARQDNEDEQSRRQLNGSSDQL